MSDKKPRAKRQLITICLTDETIQLARSLAKLYMEDEKKLGDIIEETILFYSANREDQSRTNTLLKVTEDNLLNQFKEQVESMYREFKSRDKLLAERVASLIAIQGFESTLTELMLKDIFCENNPKKNRYEELRRVASRKMKDRYEKSDMGKMAELTEKITDLENKIEKDFEVHVDEITKYMTAMKIKNGTINTQKNEISDLSNDLDNVTKYAKELERLVKWYEERDERISYIQERNKNRLGIKQKYEESKNVYENENTIPETPKVPKFKSSTEFGIRRW